MDGGSDDLKPSSDAYERGYVIRTLRSTAAVSIVIVLVLASYGQNALVLPFLAGVLLAAALLWGLEKFVRGVFSPASVRQSRETGRDKRWALLGFALIKYPLVALFLWMVVRVWGSDTRRILAFTGGFLLLQVVIALRAAGKALTDGSKQTR